MSTKIVVNPVVAQTNMNFSTVISEVDLVGGNTKEWWVDTGATRHVYLEKKMFSTHNPVGNKRKIFMGNSSTSKIEGIEKVVLKMTTVSYFERCTACARNSKEPCIWLIVEQKLF